MKFTLKVDEEGCSIAIYRGILASGDSTRVCIKYLTIMQKLFRIKKAYAYRPAVEGAVLLFSVYFDLIRNGIL